MNLLWAAAVLTLAAAGAASAFPPPPLDVPSLLNSADLVIVGDVDPTPDGVRGAKIHVQKLLKGTWAGPRQLIYVDQKFSISRLNAIFFLRRQDDGYLPVSPFYPFLRAAPISKLRFGPDVDAIHAIADYQVSLFALPAAYVVDDANGLNAHISVLRPGAALNDRMHRLSMVVTPTPTRQAEDTYFSAFDALRCMPNDLVLPMARQIAGNPKLDPVGRLFAMEVLIRGGDYGSVLALLPYLVTPVPNGDLVYTTFATTMRGAPAPAPALDGAFLAMMKSRNGDVREAAAFRVRDIQTEASTHALLTALYDDNVRVRVLAASGLCERTGKCGARDTYHYAELKNAPELASIVNLWERAKD